ncbi:NAD(P)/FAD-dependent oxidoreductase [Paracoccus tibetensis]|uniref:3-phenylpropionate/trans-cinnamate dioxygenase ferredoxin reductase subunit n=1 Tax=Paracoccus tibetensis TaxID=336292 RepID=A0A1G5D2S9_9RHOB|nr:FAD-dependent oxidoreductase [Paracoccus tibetensis]SCY08818.1 3-phenylpropionate/trans-cinnamate dioxygenase ferredoxin reductase subunit [Paracoccus tibetensis]
MSQPGVIIVGAGQGGLQAAISLRQEGYTGPVTLIGAEPGLPYQRPPLSKAYLAAGDAEALVLRPESFFAAKDITYLHSTTVEAIDRDARRVVLPGGRLDYDRLILATGTRNLRPPIAGLDRALDLRTLADAGRLREVLASTRRVAVIGGGFIGLEFAAAARKLGHQVAVIEAAERLMARVVSPLMSRYFAMLHHDWGTEVHLGQPAVAVDETGVTLADGAHVPADTVLLAAGVCPNTELAEAAELAVENGIRLDAQLRTSDPAIFALGDCASFPDPRSGRQVRLESVQAATDHARLIAAQIAKGATASYAAVPWFWSDQGDRKLQIAGLAGADAHEEILADGIVARVDAIGVAALETVNKAGAHMRARRLLAGHAPVSLDELKAAVLKTAA